MRNNFQEKDDEKLQRNLLDDSAETKSCIWTPEEIGTIRSEYMSIKKENSRLNAMITLYKQQNEELEKSVREIYKRSFINNKITVFY